MRKSIMYSASSDLEVLVCLRHVKMTIRATATTTTLSGVDRNLGCDGIRGTDDSETQGFALTGRNTTGPPCSVTVEL